MKNIVQVDNATAVLNEDSGKFTSHTKRNAPVTVSSTKKKKRLSTKKAKKKLSKRERCRKPKKETDKFVTPSTSDSCNVSLQLGKRKKAESEEDGNTQNEIEEAQAEVDIVFGERQGGFHVFRQGSNIYDAMLNQTNISNNNNKYFLMQVLEDNTGRTYSVWFRWGRVGFRGQTNLINCDVDSRKAVDIFCKKFEEKTNNKFEERDNFQKYPGKYDFIKVHYKKKNKTVIVTNVKETNVKDSEDCLLNEKVRRVMELICDLKQMEDDILKMEYDVKKCPLGNISKEQVKAGYEALCAVEQHILRGNFNGEYLQALNDYYTRIPHCFGMRVPVQIRSLNHLKNEITLLEMLGEIEIAVHALTKQSENSVTLHTLYLRYQQLKWKLEPIKNTSKLFKMIKNYLHSSHGKTHSSYRMRISNVFELRLTDEKHVIENKKFRQEIGNRTLLWHGSRMTNWFGILSQGLRIAPDEAPMTGYMFGKGVYFADSSSKSANYTLPEPKKPRFMILSEVALGEMNELYKSDFRAHILPAKKYSVKGIGRYYPDPKGDIIFDGVRVPCGQLIEASKLDERLQLLYNEYIVYDTRQIYERFLVELDFEFDF